MIIRKAQSIFEYFILTAVILAIVLFFADKECFKNIQDSYETAFNRAVGEILQ